ncbi:MAG: symmetrical bis(5'-nucleosyl)-tetraphosphatase [Neisseriales bacterium]|nr:MAG: symmetrical bis(5'-nucleosyl)-tetraphosphatase [Neisseriales bacterium]
MADYAIGDIHGCFDTFMQLLQHIAFNPGRDTLWLTGDLVNRGAQSLEVLRWVKDHDRCVQTVLGNHDLHLLASSIGYSQLEQEDTSSNILLAKDSQSLLNWLRHQPLLLEVGNTLIVHAGLLPKWSVDQAHQLTQEVNECLQSPTYPHFLMQLYSNKVIHCQQLTDRIRRFRKTINVTTRMRCLTHESKLDFSYQGTLEEMPSRLVPWFALPTIRPAHYTVVFGHWSAIGPFASNHALAIDGGCVWGKQLVAVDLASQQIYAIPGTLSS